MTDASERWTDSSARGAGSEMARSASLGSGDGAGSAGSGDGRVSG